MRTRRQSPIKGFCGIGLQNPKFDVNVGGVLRAADVYQANFVAVVGKRYHKSATDTTKAYRNLPLFHYNDMKDAIPYDCFPIGIELCDRAQPIYNFVHPKRAFYIFGQEDGSLGKSVLDWCKYVLYIPTNGCMNLAATVNVVMYDRLLKNNK